LCRDVAGRFNRRFGAVFRLPDAITPSTGGRIMDLQYAESKMSRVEARGSGTLFLTDSNDVIRDKIVSAVTDSDRSIRRDREKPGISNVLVLFAGLTRARVEEMEEEYRGRSYEYFKTMWQMRR
jgi:tryptophanyl-tRNA synthetase